MLQLAQSEGRMRTIVCLTALVVALGPMGCGEEDPNYLDDDFWGQDDGAADVYSRGMPDPGWEVWQPVHAWSDQAPNGETYDEYYATWLETINYDNSGSRGEDVQYPMADGQYFPAPYAECSDTGIFVRFLFAMEHGLPMFMRGGGQYFGHFGWLDRNGNRQASYGSHPLDAPRGSYAPLQNRSSYQRDDPDQPYPSGGTSTGVYLDSILKNKRFGYFIQDVWNMLYSGNIVEDNNTYYIHPLHIRGGDLQMHRSDNDGGIGHTITIQMVERMGENLVAVDVLQSYMPTLPWIIDGYSELTGYEPDPSVNSGLRRWRTPVLRDGRWHNEIDTSVAAQDMQIMDAPDQFTQLFDIDLQALVETRVNSIETARLGQYDNPNSCRRREDREAAFDELYELYRTNAELYQPLGFDYEPTLDDIKPEVDRMYRTLDDFIWAEMNYDRSWICHWNPSDTTINNQMYDSVVAYNQQVALANGCEGLRIFRLENVSGANGAGGLSDFSDFATGFEFPAYNNDENGSLSGVVTDELADPNLIDYFCTIYDDLSAWTH